MRDKKRITQGRRTIPDKYSNDVNADLIHVEEHLQIAQIQEQTKNTGRATRLQGSKKFA
jgi:hypothetical protein